MANCPYCGLAEPVARGCAARRRLLLRAIAAGIAGAAFGALGALLVLDRPNAGILARGAVLGAVFTVAAWEAATAIPLR